MQDQFFEPLDPEVIDNPYPTYRKLRETHPVYWHEKLNSWVLTRYADCVAVLGNSDQFAADFRKIGIPTPNPLLSLQTLDPPEQTPLRNFAIHAVHAQDFAQLERDANQNAEKLLDSVGDRESFDFVTEFSDPFTLGTICRLVGVNPPKQDESWDQRNKDLDRSMDAKLLPNSEEAGLDARSAFNALVDSWLSAGPTRGILGYVSGNYDQAGVSHDVLLSSIRAFWHAGFEVPSRFLCSAVMALLRNGGIGQLQGGRSLDYAVEELVRFAGPVHAVSRACTADTQISGQKIRKGDVVVVMIAAANRDPEQFDNPEELNLGRFPNPHLGFGRGAHACLGTNVARMEAKIVLSKLIESYPEVRLAGKPVQRANATLRGPANLPVSLGRKLVSAGVAV